MVPTNIHSSHDLACFKCYITFYYIPIKIFPRIQAVPSSGKHMSRADFMFHYTSVTKFIPIIMSVWHVNFKNMQKKC